MTPEARTGAVKAFQTEARAALDARQTELDSDAVATVVYTSGTTGSPRGAVLTHGALLHEARALVEAIPIGPEDEEDIPMGKPVEEARPRQQEVRQAEQPKRTIGGFFRKLFGRD